MGSKGTIDKNKGGMYKDSTFLIVANWVRFLGIEQATQLVLKIVNCQKWEGLKKNTKKEFLHEGIQVRLVVRPLCYLDFEGQETVAVAVAHHHVIMLLPTLSANQDSVHGGQ